MPFWADWVLNPRLDARMREYLPRRQRKGTRFLLGSEFAFLRHEFERNYNRVEFRSQVKKILFTFGGGDDRGAILFCLEATKTLHPNIKRVILTTRKNPK